MLKIAAAQTAPVLLDRAATTAKVIDWIERAGREGVDVLAFGETFLPGYPAWVEHSGGARFEDPKQTAAYAAYLDAAVRIDGPEIAAIADAARAAGVFVVLGAAERGAGPGSGSVYCAVVPIDPERGVLQHHRKLVPTYEERLVWAPGDGHGLRAHEFRGVRLTALACWENWMPQARHAMYAQGAELHVALWPGDPRNTADITRFVALEGRVFVLSAAALLRRGDVPAGAPLPEPLDPAAERHGGSAIAAPDGRWLVSPVADEETLVVAEIDPTEIGRARQSFDPTGHYSRPDVFDVRVDRARRAAARFTD